MTNTDLLALLQKAAQEKWINLDLSGKGLKALPPEIAQLTHLQNLNLRGNQLTTLPPELAQLTALTKLHLSDNYFPAFPAVIAQLPQLRELYLSGNELSTLPPAFAQLTQLFELHLSGNQFTSLPAEVGQLAQLRILHLNRNQFTELPLVVTQLAQLQYLYLTNNQLASLPSAITRLTKLRHLFLTDNQLTSLPLELAQLAQLERLDVRRNPLAVPPEILEDTDNPAAIINYLARTAQTERPLNEAKLILVGEGNVGKTSLANRLIESKFNEHERKTEGIAIRHWGVRAGEHDIRLNVWDFGGQEIMHATHQFFLTRRSLYLLVVDARQTVEVNRVEYWLKMIQSFGGDSPVILVGNKTDLQTLDLNQRGLQDKYKNIHHIFSVSCRTGAGLPQLQAAIVSTIAQLPNIHDPLPLPWFEVKRQLEALERDYMAYDEYLALCAAQKVTDETSQRTLLGFLHDLGIALNFSDDPRLADTNILDPEWVTQGVYKILNDNRLITQHKGVLTTDMLGELLEEKRYPRSKRLFIVDMMQKFELCFELEGTDGEQFLIPDLLPSEEPDTGMWDGALAFQYHYPAALPRSVISRFIVRMQHSISRQTYWRTGVVLASPEGHRALVKADLEDRRIFILIVGPEATRRGFLTAIRNEFTAIHKTMAKLEVLEKVPLPRRPDIAVEYQHLLTLERLGHTTFIPEGTSEVINVRELLDGIAPAAQRRAEDLNATQGGGTTTPPTPTPTPPAATAKPSPILLALVLVIALLAIFAVFTLLGTYFPQSFIPALGAAVVSMMFIAIFIALLGGSLNQEGFLKALEAIRQIWQTPGK